MNKLKLKNDKRVTREQGNRVTKEQSNKGIEQ